MACRAALLSVSVALSQTLACCETADTFIAHHMLCLLCSQFLVILIVPFHRGMPG